MHTCTYVHTQVDWCLEQKAPWIARYREALKVMLPKETDAMSDAQLSLLASNVMDSMLFAGGQSVQTVICFAIGLLYSERASKEVLPANFQLTEASLPQYVLEVVRFFSPVGCVGWAERTVPPCRTLCALEAAQRDPAAWGDNAHHFVMRPLEVYARLGVGWAEPALVDGDNGAPNSRACPGKDLSIAMVTSFLRAFLKETASCSTHPTSTSSAHPTLGEDANLAQWIVAFEDPKAEGISWTANGLTESFTLKRS